jgi:hypothetical protein
MNKERIDVIALQEIHTKDDNDLQNRGYIAGYIIIGAIHHKQYGIATSYVKENIDDTMVVHKANSGNTQVLSTKIGSITITNVYKPPNNKWESNLMKTFEHPAIYVGDFNSHNMAWGYEENDENGDILYEWLDTMNMELVFSIKDKGTFRSARWLKEYTPDLSIISKPPNDSKQLASRRILCDFPHSQHRPVVLEYGLKIPIIRSIPKPRWNFRKANWTEFAKELDHLIQWIPAKAECYDRFVGAIKMIAKKYIPRGFRKQFIPGWDETCNELYAEFQRSKDNNIADELINNLNSIRKQRWHEKTENLDFTHSSHKAWSLMKKLGTSNNTTKGQHTLRPNSIATRLKSVGKLLVDKEHKRLIKTELRNHRKMLMPHPTLDTAFTQNDVCNAIKKTKINKAAGFDGIYSEFFKFTEPRTHTWLTMFYNDIIDTEKLPKQFKRAKVIALLKPGKDGHEAADYRPISLLSVTYKILERMILERIQPYIEDVIPIEHAGFREYRGCEEQVLALTTLIESGFQRKFKTSVAFIDLSAAYDTVWRDGLLNKFAKVIPCKKLFTLLDRMLTNRRFKVFLGNKESNWRTVLNGLPQGSVLAPTLFNLYIHDLPVTKGLKFQYADDIAIAYQSTDLEDGGKALTEDLSTMNKYFSK